MAPKGEGQAQAPAPSPDAKAAAPAPDVQQAVPPLVQAVDKDAAVDSPAPCGCKDVPSGSAGGCRFKTQFTRLREFVRRQVEVRQALHDAVAGRKSSALHEALSEVACELLLPIEITWGKKELLALEEEEENERRKEATRKTILKALEEDNLEELTKALEQAKVLGCPMRDIRRAEVGLEALQKKAEKEQRERDAWNEVEAAIQASDHKNVVVLLEKYEDRLPAEKVESVRKKLPAMQARADLRKEVNMAMQRWSADRRPEDLMKLQCLARTIQRSALPKEEMDSILAFVDGAKKSHRQKAGARPEEAVAAPPPQTVQAVTSADAGAPPAAAGANASSPPPAAGANVGAPPAAAGANARAPSAAAGANAEAPPAAAGANAGAPPAAAGANAGVPPEQPQAPAQAQPQQEQAAPAAPAGGGKQPTSPLEIAVASGNKAAIAQAMKDLKATGLKAHDLLKLQKQAIADFGGKS